ncbi:dephospho-CoA kinase [Friedmanniella endophytica]|uniref:Dephospho-CoA kinase n=1 Tax=Microlunatus kandeliicorticis TaxID=1759536 RepID=A0A7W3IS81_9ACTN|nr:dephospho-CoA kinase [Microlunatus kandeliicorticis]MBA8794284.1 dephospho-CoA kinase [Microlunatus kandeliicorticis]
MARLRVGLTGGIASGKTAVSDRLAARGAVVIDADRLAREVVGPGTPGLAAIERRFGPAVLGTDEDGRRVLDRPALGRLVFADPAARRDLEAIVHPAVRARAAELEAAAPADAVVVHVIPLLVETGQADDFDVCVVVDVEERTQLARLRDRDGLDPDAARQRLAAQVDRSRRLEAADVVIDNDGDLDDLHRQVDDLAQRWALPN